MELVPLIFGELEVVKGRRRGIVRHSREVLGDHGHPLAVAVGVWRLGVDGACNHVNKGFQKVFLSLEQATEIEGDRGIG